MTRSATLCGFLGLFVLVIQAIAAEPAAIEPATAAVAKEPVEDKRFAPPVANPMSYRFVETTESKVADRDDLWIQSAVDAKGRPTKVLLRPGSMRMFRVNLESDEFTRTGGWRWSCGDQKGQTRFEAPSPAFTTSRGTRGPLVLAVRDLNGTVHWHLLEIDMRC